MKWLRICIVISVAIMSGCIKASPTLIIKADGSGNLELNYSISEASINQMKAMSKLKQQMALAAGTALPNVDGDDLLQLFMDPDEDRITAKVKKYRDLGIELKRIKISSRNAWRFIEINLSFLDIKKLEKADFFRENGFNLTQRHDGSYLLSKPAARQKDSKAASDKSADPKELAFLSPIMSGFTVEIKFEFPGRMIDTNAHSKNLNTAEWRFEFDKDSDALSKLQNQDFRVIFEGKSLKLPNVQMNPPSGVNATPNKT